MSDKNFLDQYKMAVLNVPDELKKNMQWAVSTMKIIDPNKGTMDKAPRNPLTGERISVTSPEGWTDFETAVNSGYPAIGLRLTSEDPYVVIDLDASKKPMNSPERAKENLKARQIYDAFDTYVEKSYSQNGTHVILKGKSGVGRRKDNVEVYSQERYIICTGLIVKDRQISNGGKTLQNLIESLDMTDNPDALPIIEDKAATESDGQIIKKMYDAKNGETIKKLYTTIPGPEDDWSKLDSQLASHICFYTRNHEQALRLFRGSKLYRGVEGGPKKSGYEDINKYEQDYLIKRTFARCWFLNDQRANERNKKAEEGYNGLLSQVRDIKDRVQLDNEDTDKKEEKEKLKSVEVPKLSTVEPITGLVQAIAEYIYSSAPRPVWEVAVAGALSLMGSLVGRHYNVNGSGLGVYNIILAKTGRGKEAASSGISSIMDAMSRSMPSVHMFRGPSHIASGQALLRIMAEGKDGNNIPSKLVVLSEFGHTMNIITAKDATSADIKTRQVLLDLYSKNSWGSVIKETAYADKANNTAPVHSPNLTLLGDTTPDMFFKSVSLDVINEGFLPRFLIFEHEGKRVKANYNRNTYPPSDLVSRMLTLLNQILAFRDSDQVHNINMDNDALKLMTDFDDYCDRKINMDDEAAEMWNRAHLNALRVAGIVAVGNNMFDPVIDSKAASWAINIVKRSVQSIEIRIASGAFGRGDSYLEAAVREQVYQYYDTDIDKIRFSETEDVLKEHAVIPYFYLKSTVGMKTMFKDHKSGSDTALSRALMGLVSSGDLEEMNMRDLMGRDGKTLRTHRGFIPGPSYSANRERRKVN